MSTSDPRDAMSIVLEATARHLSGHGPGCDCDECVEREPRAMAEVRARAAWLAQATPEQKAYVLKRDAPWLRISATTPAPSGRPPER